MAHCIYKFTVGKDGEATRAWAVLLDEQGPDTFAF